MTKIFFLLRWWCWKVLAWIGALLFVLHWDGNIEDVFKTEPWLIIWWPHTETFCLTLKWACQPWSVTACVCVWKTIEPPLATVDIQSHVKSCGIPPVWVNMPHKSLLGSGMLCSVYSWSHTHIKMLMKHLFQDTSSTLFSLLYSLLLSQFFVIGSWEVQEKGLWYLSCINKHRNLSLKNQYFSNLTEEQILDPLFFQKATSWERGNSY